MVPLHPVTCEKIIGINHITPDFILINLISSQLHTCDRLGWMYCRSGDTSCRFSGRLDSEGWSGWGGEENHDLSGDLRFWITSAALRVSLCFRYLYIAVILWNIVLAILVLLLLLWLLLKLDTFTNFLHNFFLSLMFILPFIDSIEYCAAILEGWRF